VDQVVIRKVVDCSTLDNYFKGYMVFFSTIFAQTACQLGYFPGVDE
jgi:hypothetical protein